MSYLGSGVSKLTEEIYAALVEARTAKKAVQTVIQQYRNDPERIEAAVSSMNHKSSYAMGLVKAWELVTGEIWGEASWQPATGRS